MSDHLRTDARATFVASWGLRTSTAQGVCAHVLTNGRSCHQWTSDRLCSIPHLDHPEVFWQPTWRRHVVTSQPYAHPQCLAPDLETFCVVWGVRLLQPITFAASWHFPSSSALVALVSDEVLADD